MAGELDLRLRRALSASSPSLASSHEHLEVVDPALQALDPGEFALPVAERAGDLLRGLVGVVPEVRRAGLLAQLGDLGLELVDADDRPDVAEGLAERRDLVAEVEVDHGVVQPTDGRNVRRPTRSSAD